MSHASPSSEDVPRPGTLKRILIVDDEQQVLAAIEDILEDEFDVITTTSPAKALTIAENDPLIAVILSDQRMPGITGDEFLARAREFSFATRILITGYADFDAVVRAINDGKVFAYVSKPWDPEGLKVTVHHAAELSQVNRELADERSYMKALMSSSADGISIKGVDGRYLRVNDVVADILQLDSPFQAIGRRATEMLGEDWVVERERLDKQVFETGRAALNAEKREIGEGGFPRWNSTNKTAIYDERGKISGLVTITRDITALKCQQQQLELLFRVTEQVAFAERVGDAIAGALRSIAEITGWDVAEGWYFDPDAEVLRTYLGYYLASDEFMPFADASKGLSFRLGESMPGRAWRHQAIDWIEDLQAPDDKFIRREQAVQCGLRSGVAVPIMDGKGKVLSVICLFSKTMRRKNEQFSTLISSIAMQIGESISRRFTEERLTRTEERFAKIMEKSHQGVFVMRKFELIFINESFTRIFGYDSIDDAMAQKSLLKFFHADEHQRLKDFNAARVAGEYVPNEYEIRGVKKDGTEIILENRVTLVPWDDGMATCGNLVDVTEHRALQNQLQQAQKMEALGQLTGGVAHDFNNLLTVINGNLELLAKKTEAMADPKISRWIGTARRAGARGGDLTARLLAFSRRQVLEPTVLALNETVRGMEEMLARSISENIEITVKPMATLDTVRVDPAQLESAILNMSINARDAMPDGGLLTIETANVQLDACYARKHQDVVPGDYVMVAVTDTGTGIPPAMLDKVFEPFFTTKEAGKGTGLGLAMIFGFIKQSGGHINIYSEVGQGTTLRLYLPLYTNGQCDLDIDADATEDTLTGRILIVEDDEEVRETAENLLDSMGYDFVSAPDGAAAILRLETDQGFDLVMTDIVMPGGMSGIDVAREVRARWPEIKILYTSGYAEEALKNANHDAPDGIWLAKPYTERHLREKINEALRYRATDGGQA